MRLEIWEWGEGGEAMCEYGTAATGRAKNMSEVKRP